MIPDLSVLKPIHRSRLLVIRSLIEGYDGGIPFHQYLKNNFSKNKQYGSADRRIYRSWTYAWFRLGKTISDVPFYDRLIVGYFLVHGLDDDFSTAVALLFFENELTFQGENSLQNRIGVISKKIPSFQTSDLFPINEELSDGINHDHFALTMLVQPDVFIRIVKGKKDLVKRECEQHGVLFREQEDLSDCLAFEASVNLEKLLSRDKGYFEIQDRSSQVAGMAIPAVTWEAWWDCCCGAGGKSLQLLQNVTGIKLTASDIRTSVIENFVTRLSKTNAPKIRLMELDMINDELPHEKFDGIVADVPCSGSGTWARTPEKLTYFNIGEIEKYSSLQKSIIAKAVTCLKPGGKLIYITCSVFKAENEDIVFWINSLPNLELIEQNVISGIEKNSDSMYYAVFRSAKA